MKDKLFTVVGVSPGFKANPFVGWYECPTVEEAVREAQLEVAASDMEMLEHIAVFDGHLQNRGRNILDGRGADTHVI